MKHLPRGRSKQEIKNDFQSCATVIKDLGEFHQWNLQDFSSEWLKISHGRNSCFEQAFRTIHLFLKEPSSFESKCQFFPYWFFTLKLRYVCYVLWFHQGLRESCARNKRKWFLLRPGPAHGNKEVVSDSSQKHPWVWGWALACCSKTGGDQETLSSDGGGKIGVEQSRIMLLECKDHQVQLPDN